MVVPPRDFTRDVLAIREVRLGAAAGLIRLRP